jgi:hypothetical protein
VGSSDANIFLRGRGRGLACQSDYPPPPRWDGFCLGTLSCFETGSSEHRGRELGLGRPGRRGGVLGGAGGRGATAAGDLLLSRSGSRAGAFLPMAFGASSTLRSLCEPYKAPPLLASTPSHSRCQESRTARSLLGIAMHGQICCTQQLARETCLSHRSPRCTHSFVHEVRCPKPLLGARSGATGRCA